MNPPPTFFTQLLSLSAKFINDWKKDLYASSQASFHTQIQMPSDVISITIFFQQFIRNCRYALYKSLIIINNFTNYIISFQYRLLINLDALTLCPKVLFSPLPSIGADWYCFTCSSTLQLSRQIWGFDSWYRHSNLAQIGSKSSIFWPVWPWNLMDDLEKQWDISFLHPEAMCVFVRHFIAIGEFKLELIRKWSIPVKIGNVFSRVTLKSDRWPWKTIGYLF